MKDIVLPEVITAGIYNVSLTEKNRTTKKRKTTMFELELPLCDGGISFTDGESVPITSDLLICAKPDRVRHTKPPFKCYYVHMILHEGLLYDMLAELPDYFVTKKREEYKALFTQLIDFYNSGLSTDTVMMQSVILRLVATLHNECRGAKLLRGEIGSNYGVIERALGYIREHLCEDLRLETVSAKVNMSPIYFHNIFKRATARTLREYVEEQRIKKAINMLMVSEKNLTAIAMECGFSSQAYFNYVFKRKMGKPPREYAKELYENYRK